MALVIDVCGAYVMTWLNDIDVGVANALMKELTNHFSTSSLMDAMVIYYPQYWFQLNCEKKIVCHLVYIKTYYVHGCRLKSITYLPICLIWVGYSS
jgi:hypothetical protein